jgi:uroporphyrinogen decarboxylase
MADRVTDTNFDRVRRALLRQGQGDRVPLFELSIHKSIEEKFLGRKIEGLADEIDFWRTAGYDFVSARAGVRSIVRGLHPAVKQWRSIRQEASAESGKEGWVGDAAGFIRTRRDLDDFPWPAPEDLGGQIGYASLDAYLEDVRRRLPGDMKLIVQLGYLFMGAWQLMGFENFGMQLADDPEFVQTIVERLATSQSAVLEILLQHETVGAVWMPDDLCYNSGPMVAPRIYRQYIYPWYVKMVERCHEAKIPVGLHSDGDLTKLLPDLVQCGFDCIHPFEPPLNDIVQVKRTWGHRIAVAGNIDLKATLCLGTPESVAAEVRAKCAALAPGGGWLLGSSNSIPDFVPIENYRALLASGLQCRTAG